MKAFYRQDKATKKWFLMLLLDGSVASGGEYETKKDLVNFAKRELGIKEVEKWKK